VGGGGVLYSEKDYNGTTASFFYGKKKNSRLQRRRKVIGRGKANHYVKKVFLIYEEESVLYQTHYGREKRKERETL